jgi:hypothetical protein
MNAKEKAVRDAATALHGAILDARKAGLHVRWPHTPEDLAAIAISETKKATVTTQVNNPDGVSPEVAAKAGVAAQKAADKVVEKATDKA